MSFEVMLTEQYSVQDSSLRLELLGRLRSFGDIPHDEITDADLSSYLWAGAKVFNPGILAWEQIEELEKHGILLWSAMAVADFRMQSSAKYFPIKSRVGETDPSKRVDNNVKIKQTLRKQFEDYLNDNGITIGDPGILVGDLIRRNLITDESVPPGVRNSPLPVSLQATTKTVNTIDLQWTKTLIPDFSGYIVYVDTVPNLKDNTRLAESTNRGVRSDIPSENIFSVNTQAQTGLRLTDLVTNTPYWIVVVVQDFNGRVSVSNEIQVVTD